jgi:hypothetical protein
MSLRDVLTVAIGISIGVHSALAPEHWRERPVLGIGFALAAATLAATAVWLQAATSGAPVVTAFLLLAGLTALYLLSRTRGLPLTGREEWDAVGIATQVVQLAGIGAAVSLVLNRLRTTGGIHAVPTHG